MASVAIRDVRKAFGALEVIHGVDVLIGDGEFVVLVGPSGCGKSTLLRMIAGLENITSGEIKIGERVVNNVPPKERDIAMVFQNYALYPHMTVGANMAFSLKLRGAAEGRDRKPGGARRRHPRPRPPARALSAPALRRPAPTRRHGPRHRARSAGVPVRRAAVEPRCQAARADAHRDQGAAPAAQDHDGLCHPRPDRGHDHGRPDRGDARRPGGADRRAARALRPPAQPVRRRLHRLAGDEFPQGQRSEQTARPDSRDRAACGCRSATAPAGSDGRPAVYGIRPEHFVIADDGAEAEIQVVEPTGSETAGRPPEFGGEEIIAVFRERHQFQAGRQDPAQARSAPRASVRRDDRSGTTPQPA